VDVLVTSGALMVQEKHKALTVPEAALQEQKLPSFEPLRNL
jgi:hypothetical protein